MVDPLSLFKFTFQNNHAPKTLFLFPGTGGSTTDLFPLVESLAADYDFVGLEGNVSENGLSRFFVRTAPGIFDQVSIQTESLKVRAFLNAWNQKSNRSVKDIACIGYSNGANIILATVFKYPLLCHSIVLLHPQLPFVPSDFTAPLMKALVTYGENDPIVSLSESLRVVTVLRQGQVSLTVGAHQGSHAVHPKEVASVGQFLVH